MPNHPRSELYFSQFMVPHQPDHPPNQIGCFLVFWGPCIKRILSFQIEWSDLAQCSVRCAYSVISLRENQLKWCPKWSKNGSLQTSIYTSTISLYHKRNVLIMFKEVFDPNCGRVEHKMGWSVPKSRLLLPRSSHPDIQLTPKLFCPPFFSTRTRFR